jgi:hypothetical protein
MEYPCHRLPKNQWCDRYGPSGFMGHTCIKPKEQNLIGLGRSEIEDTEIQNAITLLKEKIDMRLIQKQRGSYIGNHETYGILAEEFKELLDALQKNDNEEFFCELLDIAVGAILGMASMYANKKRCVR